MSTDIVQYEGIGSSLTLWRAPEQVLAEAKKAADALVSVISQKKDKVTFNGEQYLEREDWGTVAKFYGCTAKTISTNYVNFDGVKGFEAVAVCIDANLNEIGRAESMCLSDEANWGDVPVYEWQDELDAEGKKIWVEGKDGKKRPKGKRVQTGTTPKPLFQLRSMAQTRAEAKVLKSVFGYVVVLAGYKPTPAEEMTRAEERYEDRTEKKTQVQNPQRTSEKKTDTAAQGTTAQAQQTTDPKTSHKEVSGIIETAKQAKSGMLWLTVKGEKLIVRVLEKDIDAGMIQGAFIKFRGEPMNNQQIGDFIALLGLIELQKVEEGEVVSPAAETRADATGLAPDAAKVADEMFGNDKTGTVASMVDNGTLKPASSLPEGGGKKPGTIGVKRAQRIYTLISQNKKTNNEFSETELKKILSAFPNPIDHLRDLESGMYEEVEKWATGEKDWRDFWKDDE